MKHDLLTPMDDLTLTPSKVLNETTLAMMQEGKQKTPATKRMPRRMLACAALVCAACMLMSMGYRVFSYLAYVPGAGIVSGELENTYTLVEAVQEGGYYVEAMSLVPQKDSTWSVHVITNRPTYTNRGENSVPPLTLTDPEGNTTTIPFSSGGSDHVTRYAGSIDHATPGIYTLRIEGTTYTVELSSLTNSPFADYSYPTDNGITLICFPMSEGSDKLVFDMILGRHRTILMMQMRRQIFRQTKQIHRRLTLVRQGGFVKYDGKDTSRCAIKALAVNCAVVP